MKVIEQVSQSISQSVSQVVSLQTALPSLIAWLIHSTCITHITLYFNHSSMWPYQAASSNTGTNHNLEIKIIILPKWIVPPNGQTLYLPFTSSIDEMTWYINFRKGNTANIRLRTGEVGRRWEGWNRQPSCPNATTSTARPPPTGYDSIAEQKMFFVPILFIRSALAEIRQGIDINLGLFDLCKHVVVRSCMEGRIIVTLKN